MTSLARQVAAVAALVTLPLVALTGGIGEGEPVARLLLTVLGALAGAAALAARAGSRGPGPRDPATAWLGRAGLLLALGGLLSWLVSPLGTLPAAPAALLLGGVGLGLGLSVLGVRERRWLGWLGLASAVAAAALTLGDPLQRPAGAGRDPEVAASRRASGSFADAETAGLALAAAGAAMAAVASTRAPGPGGRAIWLAFGLIAAGTVATLSRGALLALMAGALAALALARPAGGGPGPLARTIIVGALAVAAALGIVAASGRTELVRARLDLLSEARDPVTPSRPALARLAVGLIAERPLLGHGPGSFPWLAPRVTRAAREAGRLPPAVEPWPHAQNDLLELAATHGLPAALLALAVFVRLVGLAIARARESGDPAARAAVAMLISLAVSALLHHPLASAPGLTALAVAVSLALGPPRPRAERPGAALPAAAILVLGAGASLALGRIDSPERALLRALRLERAGERPAALAGYERFAVLAPPGPRVAARVARAAMRAGDLAAAERHLRRSLADWPHHQRSRVLLGEVLLDTGRRAEGLAELARVEGGGDGRRARALEARAAREP